MVRVVAKLVPVIFCEAKGELVGVEGGAGGHGENLAGVRVHGDDGSDLAFEDFFGGHLDVEVDGEAKVCAGGGKLLAEVAKLFAVTVDDDVAAAVFSAEESDVSLLDTGAADDVAGRGEGVAGGVEHLLGDLADIADERGGEAEAVVETRLLFGVLELGEFVVEDGHECRLV